MRLSTSQLYIAMAVSFTGFALMWWTIFLAIAQLPLMYSAVAVNHILKALADSQDLQNAAFLALLATICVASFIAYAVVPRRKRHGDARWANAGEVRRTGLFAKVGVILGQWGSKLLISASPTHIAFIAPTRSGKGISFVVPNLLNWAGSAVVLDMKKELFEITSGFRSQFQKVFVFDPMQRAGHTHRFNVFDTLSENTAIRSTEVRTIAYQLIPNQDGTDPYWTAGARDLFVAAATYLLETGQHVSIPRIYAWVMDGTDLRDRCLAAAVQYRDKLSQATLGLLNAFGTNSEKVASGYRGSLTAALEAFANPLVAAATDESDFTFGTIRRDATTIYMVIRPRDLEMLLPLMGVMSQRLLAELTEHEPNKGPLGDTERYKVFALLDEFTGMGELKTIKKGIAFVAGYWIRIAMVFQSESQLEGVYGRAGKNEIIENCADRVVYAPNNIDTAERISRELGTTTVKAKSRSVSSKGTSTSYSEQAMKLLHPDEIKRLGEDNLILLRENTRPIFGRKIRYYKDRRFTKRLLGPMEQPDPVTPPERFDFLHIDESLAHGDSEAGSIPHVAPVAATPPSSVSSFLAGLED